MAKYYITTPIYYASGSPHIGHAYTTVLVDIAARYHRLKGDEVKFLTGMDEHGQKIAHVAAAAGQAPQVFVDSIAEEYRDLFRVLGITNDDFIRTTEARHKAAVAEFWKRAAAGGHIFKKKYTGLYCVGCESFKTEKDLVDGICPDHQRAPSLVEEENYFFRLSSFTEQVRRLFDERPDFVTPEDKRTEMYRILEGGLEDISISRRRETLSWGIPVPGDEDQVIYVWFDALINYLTALGFPDRMEEVNAWWPEAVHVVGKEISRFHTLLWPAMLMAAGVSMPRRVVVHGWITVEGQKMSKTVGNVIDARTIVAAYGRDVFRYYVGRELPITRDGDYSEARLRERYTADLAHGLGNLLNRTVVMAEKYCAGAVPPPAPVDCEKDWKAYITAMDAFAFDDALDAVWVMLSRADKFINDEKPWKLAGTNDRRVGDVIYYLLETLTAAAVMVSPFMPETADRIVRQLGLDPGAVMARGLTAIRAGGNLAEGARLAKGEPLFPPLYVNI